MIIEKPNWIINESCIEDSTGMLYVCEERPSLIRIVTAAHEVILDTDVYITVSAKNPDIILENDPIFNRIVTETLPPITFPYEIPDEPYHLYVERFECEDVVIIGCLALKQKNEKPMKIMQFFRKDEYNIYDEISFKEYMKLKITKLYEEDPAFKSFVMDYAKKKVKSRSDSMGDMEVMVEATQHFL
ncbi:MAG: hypothetical protein K2H85_09570 [Allobaculum sp.]|nr:hypothetical protein [Allobaculum sp.]